jgi:hypothetical protein
MDIMETAPAGSTRSDVQLAVAEDIARRRRHGIAKHGQALRPHDGTDALAQAYWQALDLVFYLKQQLMERESHKS